MNNTEKSERAINWSQRADLVELSTIHFGQQFKAIDGETYRKLRYIRDTPGLGLVVERMRDQAIDHFCSTANVEAIDA